MRTTLRAFPTPAIARKRSRLVVGIVDKQHGDSRGDNDGIDNEREQSPDTDSAEFGIPTVSEITSTSSPRAKAEQNSE